MIILIVCFDSDVPAKRRKFKVKKDLCQMNKQKVSSSLTALKWPQVITRFVTTNVLMARFINTLYVADKDSITSHQVQLQAEEPHGLLHGHGKPPAVRKVWSTAIPRQKRDCDAPLSGLF